MKEKRIKRLYPFLAIGCVVGILFAMPVSALVPVPAPDGSTAMYIDEDAIPEYIVNAEGRTVLAPAAAEEFWKKVIHEIKEADAGETVSVSVSKAAHVPVSVVDAVAGKDVVLKMTGISSKIVSDGTISLDGNTLESPASGKVFYSFEALAAL